MTDIFRKNGLNISVIISIVLRVNYKEMMGTEKIEYGRSGAYDCTQIKKSLQT